MQPKPYRTDNRNPGALVVPDMCGFVHDAPVNGAECLRRAETPDPRMPDVCPGWGRQYGPVSRLSCLGVLPLPFRHSGLAVEALAAAPGWSRQGARPENDLKGSSLLVSHLRSEPGRIGEACAGQPI
jgi:hypothetical protein